MNNKYLVLCISVLNIGIAVDLLSTYIALRSTSLVEINPLYYSLGLEGFFVSGIVIAIATTFMYYVAGNLAKKYNRSLYFMVCTTVLLVSLFRLSLGLNNIYLVSMVS